MNIFLRTALRQPSTWRGLVWIVAGTLGLTLSAADMETLAAAAMIVAGLLGAIPLDRGREDLVRDRLPPIDLVARPEPEPVSADRVYPDSGDLPTRTDHQAPDRRDSERGGWNG